MSTHLVATIVGIVLGIGAAITVGALVARVRRRAAIDDESSRAAARMLVFASHEIRNPVHGIAGLAELLERSALDAEQRRIVATIRETAFGLGRLADDFLQHARLSLGQLPPRPAATSPAALVGSVLALNAQPPIASASGSSRRSATTCPRGYSSTPHGCARCC